MAGRVESDSSKLWQGLVNSVNNFERAQSPTPSSICVADIQVFDGVSCCGCALGVSVGRTYPTQASLVRKVAAAYIKYQQVLTKEVLISKEYHALVERAPVGLRQLMLDGKGMPIVE
ncbi:hypothetical protein K0U07_00830 [bacterium]|nr:hypothetical protein [bacterium]